MKNKWTVYGKGIEKNKTYDVRCLTTVNTHGELQWKQLS